MTDFVIKTTELVVFCLPFIKTLAIIGLLAAAVVYLFRARFLRHWIRICAHLAGAVLIVPLVIAVLLLVSMAACNNSRPKVLVSPDSRHVAEYLYEAGFLGRDTTVVTVRTKWSIFPHVAYQYAGPSDWTGTEVQWLSNDRLLVAYTLDRRDHYQECKTEAAGIVVQCVATK